MAKRIAQKLLDATSQHWPLSEKIGEDDNKCKFLDFDV